VIELAENGWMREGRSRGLRGPSVMKVCVASPYPLSELKGNSVTTDRIVAMLNEGGVEARGSHGNDGEPADILITLHAIKGAHSGF